MKAVSLFSGAGGMDLGLFQAGLEIVWANDNDADAVSTYRRNIGNHVVLGDIREIDSSEIPECDVVVGGFPCQGFSEANWRRTLSDDRNTLYRELLRVVGDLRPAHFIAENVKGLVSMEKGAVLGLIVRDFEALGYKVHWRVLNAADYGVPQRRQRVIILGSRQDAAVLRHPRPTHSANSEVDGLRPWVTVGEALAHVPEPEDTHELLNHTYSKYKLRFNNYLGHRVIDPNLPAPTVTARGDDQGGVVVLHHPKNHRRMSARELATVQSFPMDFEFCGTQTSAYRQIGNAVPPLLARALGRSLLELDDRVSYAQVTLSA